MVKRKINIKKNLKYEVVIGVEPEKEDKHLRTKKILKLTEESQKKKNLKLSKHEDIFKKK